MKFVSPYYLAKKFEWNVEWLDQSKIIELRQKLQTEEGVLFDYEHHEITTKDALDFLNQIGDPQTLQFCLWIHSVEPLEQLLHERQITSEKPFEISNEIQYSGQLAGLQRFIAPYLKESTVHAGKAILDERKFDDFAALDGGWQFFSDQNAVEEVKLELADHLIEFFDEQIIQDQLLPAEELTFLQGFDVVDFLNAWPFQSAKRDDLLKRIKDWEPIFRGRSEESLVQAILTNLSHVDGLRFQLNFHQPKPDESYADMAIEQIRSKKKAEQDRNKKVGIAVLGIIGVIVIVLLVVRNRMLGNEQEIVGVKDRYGNVKYYLEDDGEDEEEYVYEEPEEEDDSWWYDTDDDEPSYTNFEWRQQINILKGYAKNNRSTTIKVSSTSEYASLDDMESISNPFIEFFYPLHNKKGDVKHSIRNDSDYGVIMLVKSTPDCYSYFIPSHTTYEESFRFNDDDEIVFYLGKSYVETPDLLYLMGRPAGFEYTDEVSKEQLRLSYKVSSTYYKSYGNQVVLISNRSTPSIEFNCDVGIRVYKDGKRL